MLRVRNLASRQVPTASISACRDLLAGDLILYIRLYHLRTGLLYCHWRFDELYTSFRGQTEEGRVQTLEGPLRELEAWGKMHLQQQHTASY